QALAEAEQEVIDSGESPRGILRITAPGDMGSLLNWIVCEFLESHPGVDVFLDLTNRYVDLVAEGYDLALRAGRLEDSSYIARPVFEARFELYASPAYIARRGRPENVDDLTDHQCLIFGADPATTWKLSSRDGTVQVPVRGRLLARDFAVLHRAAKFGSGIALLPNFLARPDVHTGELERLLPDHSSRSTGLYLVYPSRELLPAKTRAFITHLDASFATWEVRCPAPTPVPDPGPPPAPPRPTRPARRAPRSFIPAGSSSPPRHGRSSPTWTRASRPGRSAGPPPPRSLTLAPPRPRLALHRRDPRARRHVPWRPERKLP